jgi:hypothetical protein
MGYLNPATAENEASPAGLDLNIEVKRPLLPPGNQLAPFTKRLI